ncbi:MAG: hypothetical protein IT424_07470, partial [Pirellulales bacterium]|nr:hypothetical protein [Pirellulales bacterium]
MSDVENAVPDAAGESGAAADNSDAGPVQQQDADRLAQPIANESPPRLPFPIVGLGGSAGGIEAFIE